MTDANTLYIRGYTVDGFQVSVTLDVTPVENFTTSQMILFGLDAVRESGIVPREQGVEAGEQVATLAKFSVRHKKNQDGTITPDVDFYINEDDNLRHLHVYLNTEAMREQFEAAVGWKLAEAKVNPTGNAATEDNDFTREFIHRVRRPVRFVWMKNPDWDDTKAFNEQAKKGIQKREFVRWMDAPAPAASQPPTLAVVPKAGPQNAGGDKFDDIPTAFTFICHTISTRIAKNGKAYFVFRGDDNVSANAFSLTDLRAGEVYDEARLKKLHEVGNYNLSEPIKVHWVPDKDDMKKATRIEKIAAPAPEQSTDIPF